MKILILASGPSARKIDFDLLPADVQIMGVNGTVHWAPRLDYWFTLDRCSKNKMRFQNRRQGVRYFAALPAGIHVPPGVTRLNRVSLTGRNGAFPTPATARRGTPEWWFWWWSATPTLSEVPGTIHTGNSAWGALQLAVQLGYREIYLAGVDGTQDRRVEGGRPNNLSHLPLLFISALPQLERLGARVINLSMNSRVECFEKIEFEKAFNLEKVA
ncbi:MAG: norphogenetic protein [Nitrospinaceae bacterium]|nr:norphogenetic protein [Nitrospinaceae bacterium]NIR55601.1 norphogenetic protein [Nitrospinaceae bacterium]NIS86035.1 norphogenetic protein [Nitrospinaceae bacterium]NIT82878.1 norphogenetic protein [Nitrospinaceae bacterium]NIU45083.1 norphogenetic protein [Nitrospinaceae bacterium]